MLTDSHCHLDHLDLEKTDHQSLDDVLAAAREKGVSRVLSVAVNLETSQKLIDLAAGYDEVMVSAGVHPLQGHLLQEKAPELPEPDRLRQLAANPQVVALGETGLDYYYGGAQATWQGESFKRHLQVAAELDKPVIVHSREARKETLALLRAHWHRDAGGVLHCFTETWGMAEALLKMGFYLSFSGIITFKNAAALRDVVRQTPLDRLLVETDAPWLAPVPHRGRQNEPQYVREVAQGVADIKGLSLEIVAEATSRNFDALFIKQ